MTEHRDDTGTSPALPVKQPGGGTPRAAENHNAVWSDNMLSALHRGVKGGKWFSLIDKVFAIPTLEEAFRQVQRNKGAPGCDHVTVEKFADNLDAELVKLSRSIRENTYRPSPVRRRWICKEAGGKRPLGIPSVRDRVVQAAVRLVIEPIFEHRFHDNSFGFRPGRGCKDALREIDRLLRDGYTYVIDADIKGYFDSIDHERLLAEANRDVADGRVLKLLEKFLNQPVLEDLALWQPTEGTPQGAVISPLLANIFLDPLDFKINGLKDAVMIRYADDFIVLCRSQATADRALRHVRAWTEEVGLTLHPDKTHQIDMLEPDAGFDFLGYRFVNQKGTLQKRPAMKAVKRMRGAVKQITRRRSGYSLSEIINLINPKLRGWFEYFKHSQSSCMRAMDGFIRRRLRTLIRHRRKRRGITRGRENYEYPNTYFAKRGLFTLETARAEVRQSVHR